MSTSQPQLSNQQYEVVLKYMETTNEDDFDRAVEMLRAHDFQLQNAVNTKFGLTQDAHQTQNHNQNTNQEFRRTRSQEDIKKYIQYLREKQNRSIIGGIFVFAKNLLVGLLSGLTQLILPEFLLLKIMRTRFYVTYKQLILPQFRDRTLSYLLRTSNLSRKPIMYAIAAPGTVHQCFIDLFNRPQIVKKIDEGFIFSGGMADDSQDKQIEGEKQPPSIIVCRKNIFEKIEIIKRYIGYDAISQIDVHKLNYALRDHQRATRKDKNLLVKYRNYVRSHYYGGRAGFYEQQQEQQLYQGSQPTVISDMIQKQNQDYKKIEEETKRKNSIEMEEKQRMFEEQKKLQQLQQQRRIRKLSIPEQPNQGQIIRINFRCPDGTTKTRNFDSNEKLDLVYHYVETNQEIQFQDNNKRIFQLMYGFPPSSLADKRQELLKNVFESDQQKIMIREL